MKRLILIAIIALMPVVMVGNVMAQEEGDCISWNEKLNYWEWGDCVEWTNLDAPEGTSWQNRDSPFEDEYTLTDFLGPSFEGQLTIETFYMTDICLVFGDRNERVMTGTWSSETKTLTLEIIDKDVTITIRQKED